MSADQARTLLDIFRCFPGIHADSDAQATGDGGVLLTMRYDDHLHGKIARMVVEHIAARVGARQHGDEVRCDAKQGAAFVRLLNYASLRPMGAARPLVAPSATPLPTLLSHALICLHRGLRAPRRRRSLQTAPCRVGQRAASDR